MKRSKIESIEVSGEDVTFYFEGTKEPFNAREFTRGSFTWEDLKRIEAAVQWFNAIVDAEKLAKGGG